ncbi:MAG: T9SS type A sorting domain-containing protein [Bacteroidetes bacterium]|nr:T9SS type A sorting domain-containing protein [Bacteroidota bacterium]
MGENVNDDDTAAADGFAANSVFATSDLPTPLTWGTTYAWRATTMWPVPPTGWVPQEIFDKNETDRVVAFSGVEQFKTVTKAIVPTLTYPVGGLTIYDNQPILHWNVGAPFDALTFTLTIMETAPGSGVACTVTGVIAGITGLQFDTTFCTSPLEAGKTYEWFVTSYDGTNTSSPSSTESFNILGNGAASASTPSYPVNDLEIYTTAPEFHWYTGTAATGLTFVAWYKERLGPPETACTGVKSGGTALPSVSVTHVDVSGLTPGATYDWCVVTSGTNGDFDSVVASFSVAGGAADGKPIASWPIGNPVTYSLDQQLNWYVEGASLGISSYTVEYCIAPDVFGDPGCTEVTGITTTYYDVTGLSYGDVVTWRVKASYINTTPNPFSDWTLASAQGGFTITGGLGSMSSVLTYPVNGLIIYETDIQFNWYVNGASLPAGSLTFEMTYSYASTFPAIGAVTQTVTSTTPYVDVAGLIPGHTYWWKVRISIDGGSNYGPYSTVATFDVHPGASAVMPRIGGPTNSIAVATANPTLSWILPTQSSSVLVYDLHIGTQPDLSDATVFGDISNTFFRVSDLEQGQYYWAVRSHSQDGTTSPLSSVGTFVSNGLFSTGVETEDHGDDDGVGNTDGEDVIDSDDVVDDSSRNDSSEDGESNIEDPAEQVLPDDWVLGQNYPNPFNPTTTIEFSMPLAAGVSVRVYNVLGQVVKTLVNGTLPPGIHRVSWDATDQSGASVSSGLYIYRMETESFQATKTLVLMK